MLAEGKNKKLRHSGFAPKGLELGMEGVEPQHVLRLRIRCLNRESRHCSPTRIDYSCSSTPEEFWFEGFLVLSCFPALPPLFFTCGGLELIATFDKGSEQDRACFENGDDAKWVFRHLIHDVLGIPRSAEVVQRIQNYFLDWQTKKPIEIYLIPEFRGRKDQKEALSASRIRQYFERNNLPAVSVFQEILDARRTNSELKSKEFWIGQIMSPIKRENSGRNIVRLDGFAQDLSEHGEIPLGISAASFWEMNAPNTKNSHLDYVFLKNYKRLGVKADLIEYCMHLHVVQQLIQQIFRFIPLKERLGLEFRDMHLIRRALTHNSFSPPAHPLFTLPEYQAILAYGGILYSKVREDKEIWSLSGDLNPPIDIRMQKDDHRLGTLGSATIQFLIVSHLFQVMQDSQEGELTIWKENCVSVKEKIRWAKVLELDSLVLMGECQNEEISQMLSECLDCLFGVLYLCHPLRMSRMILAQCMFPTIKLSGKDRDERIDLQIFWASKRTLTVTEPLKSEHSQLWKISESISIIEDSIGHCFGNKWLLLQALTHKSYTCKGWIPNERLELLGDAVLTLLTTQLLILTRPNLPSNEFVGIRNFLASNRTLAEVCISLGLQKFIIFGDQFLAKDTLIQGKILGDIIEAILGALYLDGGIGTCRHFVERFILCQLGSPDSVQMDALHPINRLNSVLEQRFEGTPYKSERPRFEILNSDPLDESVLVGVFHLGRQLGCAKAPTFLQASHAAAIESLKLLLPSTK